MESQKDSHDFILEANPLGSYKYSEKKNGKLNSEFEGFHNFHKQHLMFQNAINRLADMCGFADLLVPYWLQPYIIVFVMTLYWYQAFKSLSSISRLVNTWLKIDKRADEIMKEQNEAKNKKEQ